MEKILENKSYVFLFDVDGTLKDNDEISPKLRPLLFKLKQHGHKLGLCSSQSPVEITEFILDELGSDLGPNSLFNAGFVLEDGHVWVPPECVPVLDAQVLTTPKSLEEMDSFKEAFKSAWKPVGDPVFYERGWGVVDGVPNLLVQLMPASYRVMGSITIIERGPDINALSYQGEYDAMMTWAQSTVKTLGLQHIELAEVGNGTLRVLQKGINKGTALGRIGFNLLEVVFIGNGLNDLPAAEIVRTGMGRVMSVANAVPELKQLSHYVANQSASDGVVEILEFLLAQ